MRFNAHSTCNSTFAFEPCMKTVSQSALRNWIKQIHCNTMKELQTRKLPFAGAGGRTSEERQSKQWVLWYMAHLRAPVWGWKAMGTGSGPCGWSKEETGMGSWSRQESSELFYNFCSYEEVPPPRQNAQYRRTNKGKGGVCTKREKIFLLFHQRSIKTRQSAVMEKMLNMIKLGNQHVWLNKPMKR